MPPSASSQTPRLKLLASVNAPFSWPKSSLSSRLCGIVAQLTSSSGRERRVDSAWMCRASTFLPEPLSPVTRIVATSERATCSATPSTSRKTGDSPTTACVRRRSRRCLAACASSSMPRTCSDRSTSATSSVWSTGLETKSRAPSFIARTASSTSPDRRHDDDAAILEALAVGGVEVEAVAVGQTEIEQHHIGLFAREVRGRGGEVARHPHLVTGALELLLERPAQQLLVFDDEDQCHPETSPDAADGDDPAAASTPALAGALPAGRRMTNEVPRPGSELTSTWPPCCSTSPFEIASPRPVPANLVVKNGWKTWARFSGAMPLPSSSTAIASVSPSSSPLARTMT